MAVSSYRKAKKDQARKARETAAQHKAQQKLDMIANATAVVADYEAYIARLKGLHLDAVDSIDWQAVNKTEEPRFIEPEPSHERAAQAVLNRFKPGLLDKVLGRVEDKRKRLIKHVEEAQKQDAAELEAAYVEFKNEQEEWRVMTELSARVLRNDPAAYKESIDYLRPFDDLREFGSELSMKMTEHTVIAEFKAKESSVVPAFVLSQTATGKLSKKALSKGRFNEIYQDYVCSCVLRIVNEVLAVLPVNTVVVNVLSDMVDESTGLLVEQPVLSVLAKSETLSKMNLASVDPSDSMRNFIHNMKFSKVNGFSPVERITA